MFVFQGCFVFSLVKYKPLTYNKVYEYPNWAIGLGWCLALSSMICIPMVMVIKILQSEGPLIEVRDVSGFLIHERHRNQSSVQTRGREPF